MVRQRVEHGAKLGLPADLVEDVFHAVHAESVKRQTDLMSGKDEDKAYRALVREQSFALGRDPLPRPAANVQRQIDGAETGLHEADGNVYRDGRLWLDWTAAR